MTRKTSTSKNKKTESTVTKTTSVKTAVEMLHEFKFDFKYKNETQKKLALSIKNNDVTICSGPAGGGKTFITILEALRLVKENPTIYKNIVLTKSITQLKGEDIGILPGDEKMKLKFHMMSYLDAFFQIIGEKLTGQLIESGFIKMEVFGAIRGRSFRDCIIVADEFQNISHDNAKTFLTRFSDNTKIVVLGDVEQIDLKNKKDSSLETLINKVQNKPIEGVNLIKFSEEDIVRHRLTSYFINIFKEAQEENKK